MRDYPIDFTATALFPAWCVRLTRLDGTILRITNAESSLTVGAETFAPLPGCALYAVKHFVGGEVPSTQIDFSHSVGGTIDTAELNSGLWDGAVVQIYPVDRNSLSALGSALFTGTVQPVTISPIGQTGSFDCRGLSAKAESVIQTYSPMCRTDLFSSLCQLTAASFDHTGAVASVVDRFNITVSGLASPPADDWFNQGVGHNTTTGVKFEIANWTLSTLQLTTYLPICALFSAGDSLTLYPGCDKTKATCVSKFSNIINFQGEPHYRGPTAQLEG